jgi:hypothetical protein
MKLKFEVVIEDTPETRWHDGIDEDAIEHDLRLRLDALAFMLTEGGVPKVTVIRKGGK